VVTPVSERPVLVGGTGRSGSTIVGHLLDHHPQLALTRPMEVRFLAGRFGLADALAASLSGRDVNGVDETPAVLAVQRIMDRWYARAPDVGLHTSIDREDLATMLDEYLAGMPADPLQATRRLARAVMERVSGAEVRWVDTTPANARQADRMLMIYPHARVISVVRDGRDVAASFLQQSFGPDDVFEALRQWEQRMMRIHRATVAAPEGTVLRIELMELVVRERRGSISQLCEFLDIDEDPAMLEWFDSAVLASSAHPGRWRTQFDASTTRAIDRAYGKAVKRLESAGVSVPEE
jgi:hypothetical protein